MAPNFQSSFIPRESSTNGVFKKKETGLIGALVVFLFVTSIVASAGLFFYKSIIKGDIDKLKLQITEAEAKVDRETINQMSQFSKKLNLARSIVSKHQVISGFLDTLASSTISAVQFDNFSYSSSNQNGLSVSLKGRATSYSAIALQEHIFSQDKNFQSVSFSGLSLTADGMVAFDLNILVDAKITAYAI